METKTLSETMNENMNKNFMEQTNFQANAPVAGSEEQQMMDGVVEPTMNEVANNIERDALIEKLSNHQRVAFRDVKKYLTEVKWSNRDVSKSHVKQLKAAIMKRGVVYKDIEIVLATTALEQGCELFAEDGTTITTATPGVELMYIIIDGQHRSAAWTSLFEEDSTKEIPCYTVTPELPESITLVQYRDDINNTQRSWTVADRAKNVAEKYKKSEGETAISLMQEWHEKFGITYREGYCLIHLKDAYKKSQLVSSQDSGILDENLKGTPEKTECGKRLLEAILVACRSDLKQSRSLAPANAIIKHYDAANPTEKAQAISDIELCLKTISADELKTVSICDSVSKKADAFCKILKNKLSALHTEDVREEYEKTAAQNTVEYETLKADSERKKAETMAKKRQVSVPKEAVDAVKGTLEKKLNLKNRVPRNLTNEMAQYAQKEGADKVVKFIEGLNDSQVLDVKAYSKEADGINKLKEILSAAWAEFVAQEQMN